MDDRTKNRCSDCKTPTFAKHLSVNTSGKSVCYDCFSNIDVAKMNKRKRRNCLKCSRFFISSSIGHRLCENCKPKSSEAFGNRTVYYGAN